jgi:hypothetical protein
VSSLLTVQPLDDVAATGTATLHAQPGEFESVQVMLRGRSGRRLDDVTVSLAKLVGPDGAVIGGNDITVYREAYTRIWTPSDQEGWCRYFNPNDTTFCGIPVVPTPDGSYENRTWKCGNGVAPALDPRRCLFPDALVPERDPFYRENRNAFPLDVPAGENRMAWIDVHVPAHASPGTYTGTVILRAAGVARRNLTLNVEVATVPLPAYGTRPDLDLGGGVNVNPNLCASGAHTCAGDAAEQYRLMHLYTRASIENRMPILNPAPGAPTTATARALFEAWIQPLMAGTSGGGLFASRTPGAKLPLIMLNQHTTAAQWAAWQQLAGTHGFVDRMRFYCDELYSKAAFEAECANPYAAATGPGGWNNASHPLRSVLIGNQQMEDNARGWGNYAVLQNEVTRIPLANHLQPAGGVNTRPSYSAPGGFLAAGAGRSLWMYTSNMSVGGGAGWTPHKFWNGSPVLSGVDQPATSEAAGPITAWIYDVTGHYYYDAFQRLGQAWNDCAKTTSCLYNEGGHGDGTLYYPGTTDRIGGTHDIPIESIRLKRYRDGAETYTLLRQLASGCDGDCITRSRASLAAIVGSPSTGSGLFREMSRTSVSAVAYDAARAQLFALLPSA